MNKTFTKHAVLAMALTVSIPLSVSAQTVDKKLGQGLGLSAGFNSDYQRTLLSYETNSLFSHSFDGGSSLGIHVELGGSYWRAKKSKTPKSMMQFSAIPVVRWWPNDNLYVDLGSGPTIMSRTKFAGKNISTKFQFGSRLGVGYVSDSGHQFGIRYSHFSNASIKKPNPGLDILEVVYKYRF